MRRKPLFLAGALMLGGLSVASAKSYHITISEPAQAGQVQLSKGEYKVKVDGANAVFTDLRTGKSVTTPVTIANSDKKHETTAIESTKTDTGDKITAIDLGGSTETIQFGGE